MTTDTKTIEREAYRQNARAAIHRYFCVNAVEIGEFLRVRTPLRIRGGGYMKHIPVGIEVGVHVDVGVQDDLEEFAEVVAEEYPTLMREVGEILGVRCGWASFPTTIYTCPRTCTVAFSVLA